MNRTKREARADREQNENIEARSRKTKRDRRNERTKTRDEKSRNRQSVKQTSTAHSRATRNSVTR